MIISPLYDRLVCRPIDEGAVTKGGLLVPDIARGSRAFSYAEVVACGDGRHNTDGKVIPLQVRVGDVVLYARTNAPMLPIPDENGDERPMLLLREPEVLAIIKGLPRDTGMLDADGRRLLAWGSDASAESLRAPQVSDRELLSIEQDAKLKEEGWAEGLSLDTKDSREQARDIRE